MTIFNVRFGQARASQSVDGVPVKMYHRHVTPKKAIQLAREGEGVEAAEYRSDALGNIEVADPEDIGNLEALGYPHYVGNGTGPVKREDLEFFLDPLKDIKYRNLTEAEWAAHQEAVYQAYLQAASQDAQAGRLDESHVNRYLATIETVYGRSLTDVESRPFRSLMEV